MGSAVSSPAPFSGGSGKSRLGALSSLGRFLPGPTRLAVEPGERLVFFTATCTSGGAVRTCSSAG